VDRITRIASFVHHLVGLLDDRHFDGVALRQPAYLACRTPAFDHLADLGQCLPGRRAASQSETEAAVARLVVGTGQYQVAKTGEAHEGVTAGAEGASETQHLGQTAGDQRGTGVGAEPETVGDAGGDGQYVLDRATDLDADQVTAGVGAERLGMQPAA
jgi:hypothetical protein